MKRKEYTSSQAVRRRKRTFEDNTHTRLSHRLVSLNEIRILKQTRHCRWGSKCVNKTTGWWRSSGKLLSRELRALRMRAQTTRWHHSTRSGKRDEQGMRSFKMARLAKCSLIHLIGIHHVLTDQLKENIHIRHLMSQWIRSSCQHRMSRTRRRYDCFLEHPIVLQLSLIMMIFTINLSRLPAKDLSVEFKDRRSLVQSQEMYANLLWNHLNEVFDEIRIVQSISLVIFQHLRYQKLMEEMGVFIGEHFRPE